MQKLERGVQKVETIYEFGLNVRLLHSRRLLDDNIYTNEGSWVRQSRSLDAAVRGS